MLQYLIILLDETSVSYCYYDNTGTERRLMALDDLKAGILFAMKRNLMIQFVYPGYELPEEYRIVIESVDHIKIAPADSLAEQADVCVISDWEAFNKTDFKGKEKIAFVLRIGKEGLFSNCGNIIVQFKHISRLNIVITDTDTFLEEDFIHYQDVLSRFRNAIEELYVQGLYPQLNLLTDRISLEQMNNCNAGVENITLAPNGKFYICPAFYLEDENNTVGTLGEEPAIVNGQLYQIAYAPLCRICDAYQCRRCVWLNKKTTREVNTPSREQCLSAHLERNQSRELLKSLEPCFPGKNINRISYLDPFDILETY